MFVPHDSVVRPCGNEDLLPIKVPPWEPSGCGGNQCPHKDQDGRRRKSSPHPGNLGGGWGRLDRGSCRSGVVGVPRPRQRWCSVTGVTGDWTPHRTEPDRIFSGTDRPPGWSSHWRTHPSSIRPHEGHVVHTDKSERGFCLGGLEIAQTKVYPSGSGTPSLTRGRRVGALGGQSGEVSAI